MRTSIKRLLAVVGTAAGMTAVTLALSGCDKASSVFSSTQQQVPASAPQAASAVVPAATHRYQMVDNGTYGYEPALSENDIRNGKTANALIMMRYIGNVNGVYSALVLGEDPNNTTSVVRISCSAPCNFVKVERLSGNAVVKTETVPVKANPVFGDMLQDALSGQLTVYGQQQTGNQIAMPVGQQQTSIPQPPPLLPPVTSQFTVSAVTSDSASAASATSAASAVVATSAAAVAAPTQAPAAVEPAAPLASPGVAPPTGAAAASAQMYQTSFDCSKARSLPQYLICHDPDLAASDRELATLTQQARASAADKEAFTARATRQWNYREKTCHDKPCLAAWYAYQKDVMSRIALTGDANVR